MASCNEGSLWGNMRNVEQKVLQELTDVNVKIDRLTKSPLSSKRIISGFLKLFALHRQRFDRWVLYAF